MLARHCSATLLPLAAMLAVAALAAPAPARADDAGRFSLLEENDSLYFHTDKHYTQGLRLAELSPPVTAGDGWDRPFDFIAGATPLFNAAESSRRYALFVGQSLFTPKNLALKPPDPRDRPYAGWLYGGASLLQDNAGNSLENLELDGGIVGPGALGRQVQTDWHQFIGIDSPRGWSNQLQNEPGGMLTYERLWRVPIPGVSWADVVPQLGATVGNVFTYGAAGGLLRIGTDLGADYGPARVRPALSGTDYFDDAHASDGLGGYFYAGAQGRVVGRNIFLDGNSFRQSPSVSKKPLVADLYAGFALMWSTNVRFDFSVGLRTEEFYGQRTPDQLGTASVAFDW